MKLTVSINLGGYSFNIDEDAYVELKRYLKSLERHFAGDENCSEILSDIEARISEIFKTRITAFRQVISIEDVMQAISVMGMPEDISDNEQRTSGRKFWPSGSRRMYRDPDNRIIGGVCAGIGACWSIDPVIVRIVFVLLMLGGGLGALIYIILYMVIPEARTTAQKIEMHGEPVNIHNIKNAVKKEFDAMRKKMNL
ncbi:MAG: PspC domain-containing protein [Bacteroidales bacterium]|jgi:phage shock protein PspC (stress-responsive transcriptional regulator)|nr:PspC domain-containing protein [Bacteroidales bacterium]